MSTIEHDAAALGASHRPIRVLSVPAGHVYVRHLSPGDHRPHHVTRLADPIVSPDVPAAQWWPPPSLEATWVREHADDFDVFHLHFGFDTSTPEELSALLDTLAELGKPFVYTVHDLRNPHHGERALHDAQLDVLIPGADALITLTEGAAREITRRWGRIPLVLPHPHVVPVPLLRRPRPQHEGFIVGVHVKSLRASMEPLPVIRALSEVITELPDAILRVNVHTDVFTEGYANFDPEVADTLRTFAEAGDIELFVHDFFCDDDLWDYLQGLDLSVLPYRFGTHSGWLEACYDLGTTVLVSDCGYYTDQRPCLTYPVTPQGPVVDSLKASVRQAYERRPQWRSDPAGRRQERAHIATQHERLYEELLRR